MFQPGIATSINGTAVTHIKAGTTVHDTATLTNASADAGGTVTYRLYTDSTCTNLSVSPALNQTVNVTNGVVPNSSGVTFTGPGKWWFQATYSGDANNTVPAGGAKSPCTSEPITVVDARITIGQSGTNPVNAPHTFTVTVEKNDGTGWTPAAGAPTYSSEFGVGAITGGTCGAPATGPTNASGQCTVIVNSSVPGTSFVFASSFVTVLGVSITTQTYGYGAHDISNVKRWEGGGQIAPTQVSCQDFINGTAPTLGQINYPVSGGTIGQGVNPGVFFYYTNITTTVPNQVVTVTQTNTSSNNAALFQVHQGQARLYTGNCSSWRIGTVTGVNGSGASFTVPTPGTWVLSIKYQTKSLAGTTAPVPSTITYNFATSLGGATGASVLLVKTP